MDVPGLRLTRSLSHVRPLRVALSLLLVSVIVLAAGVVITLTAPEPTPLGRLVPSVVAYSIHAGLGIALNRFGFSPTIAATQWSRAASHARTPAEVNEAAGGIALARDQSADDWRVDDALCDSYVEGSPALRGAIAAAGAPCNADAEFFDHVPVGDQVAYASNPPVGGPHYPQWYPDYGLTDAPVAPGYWVHNLEHGAVVLLYRCTDGCPDVVANLQALYESLPTGTDARHGPPRLLITEYDAMDHPFAVVAWGRKFEMDNLDREEVVAFYAAHIDRGPECRNRICPL
jgi:hypothetical protein